MGRVILAAKRYTLPAAVLLVLHQVGEAMVPVIMGLAIDRALATGSTPALLWWLGVLALDFALLSFTFRFGSRVGVYGMQAVQHQLRMMVSDRLLHGSGIAGPRRCRGSRCRSRRATYSSWRGPCAWGSIRSDNSRASPSAR